MDQEPLVKERIEGGVKFLAEFEKRFPLLAAYWCKRDEESRWALHIASDRINDTNRDDAYGEIVRAAGAIQDPNFNLFQVTLIKADDPLVRAVAELRRRYPGRIPAHYHGWHFSGAYAEEIYIYPLPASVPSPATASGP